MRIPARGAARFFKYARARHAIHVKRVAGEPKPWTRDPILRQYKFTNVFRELDATTQWFRIHARHEMRNLPEVLLATVVFRMLNRIEVGEAVFCQLIGPPFECPQLLGHGSRSLTRTAFELFAHDGDPRHLRRAIKNALPRGPYVTGAYIITSPPGLPKLDGVLQVLSGFYDLSGWRRKAEELLQGKLQRMEPTWRWLSDQPYLGSFHSYEIVCDLRYTDLLRRAPDRMTWANPGPGARRGLNRVLGLDKRDRSLRREDLIEGMRALLALSRHDDRWPQLWPRWEMREVEHTLCEFDKYERVRLGEGTPRGRYDGG